jgi:hypothetical protein
MKANKGGGQNQEPKGVAQQDGHRRGIQGREFPKRRSRFIERFEEELEIIRFTHDPAFAVGSLFTKVAGYAKRMLPSLICRKKPCRSGLAYSCVRSIGLNVESEGPGIFHGVIADDG